MEWLNAPSRPLALVHELCCSTQQFIGLNSNTLTFGHMHSSMQSFYGTIYLVAPVELHLLELFTGVALDSFAHLECSHVWGCPVYVLDPKLQDGKKLPKWLA